MRLWVVNEWVRYVVELVREKDRDLDHLRERIADLEHQGQTPSHEISQFCTSRLMRGSSYT